MTNVRFVVVATLQRGVVNPPEPLDDANQWRAFSAWRQDESRMERARVELGERVMWRMGYEPARRTARTV